MTDDTEKRLRLLRSEIEYHRGKAVKLRKRAEAQDRIADDKVKIAAELGTGSLFQTECQKTIYPSDMNK